MSQVSLSNIPNGQSAIVCSIEQSSLKVKLMEMGLVEGKQLRVLFRAPLGDPIAIDVEGYVLSLRVDEADLIAVKLQSVNA